MREAVLLTKFAQERKWYDKDVKEMVCAIVV